MNTKTIEKKLADALFRLSFGKLTASQAQRKASELAHNIDLTNDMIAHKGINWYAKEILKKI